MLAGAGIQTAGQLWGAYSLFQGANSAEAAYQLYNYEASLYEDMAQMWQNFDLTPYYERQADLFEESAFALLSGAQAQANAAVANARARSQEAENILIVGEFNADAAEIDALTAERRTYRQLEQVADEASHMLGRQVTLVAKSGVAADSGSVVEMLMETVNTAERSLRDITVEGRLDAAKIRLGGDLARIDALGGAARAKGEAGNAYAGASAALLQGVASSKSAMSQAKSLRLEGYQSVLAGSMRAMEARTQAQITRMRGYRESILLSQQMRSQGWGKFFGAGSSLLMGMGRYWSR
jgi:hypothetical protein